MSRETTPFPYRLNTIKILKERELGLRRCIGDDDDLSRKIYANIEAFRTNTLCPAYNKGGIYNFEFNPDGQLLLAACEGKSMLLFDAYNQKLLKLIDEAHQKGVNCVKFINSIQFASCSDDGTIRTWDMRNLSSATRTLLGHSNWVKNVEYSETEKLLVTSGFDGSIYSWDLNNYSECNTASYTKLFGMMGLMRMKLTPDDSKMIITTTNGYMMIVHDLKLSAMNTDLKHFRPNLYRLMQLSEQTFPAGTIYNRMFHSTRNRLEFIDDFPNTAEVISSVQIHPMGWCALSRNVSAEEEDEWTCVHDIQMKEPEHYDENYLYVSADDTGHGVSGDDGEAAETRLSDIWIGFTTHAMAARQRLTNPRSSDRFGRAFMGVISSGIIGQNQYSAHLEKAEDKNRIVKNLPRLTHYKKEQPAGKGYIKELCFSSDGRVIASPHEKGLRIMAFNDRIQEICNCVPDQPQELKTVSTMIDHHSDVVVSCKFNPRHYQLVSGGLGGDIAWYRPLL